VDSRSAREGLAIKRRRLCPECGERFSTVEQIAAPSTVVKRSGNRVAYDRRKVAESIRRACSKGSLEASRLESMLARIEAELSRNRVEPDSRSIGKLVMGELLKHDPMAYLRFVSVYGEFKNVHEFRAAIDPLVEAECCTLPKADDDNGASQP
jgi:transcriptional repressor NrdR